MADLNVNGRVLQHDAEPDTPLLWVLREQLGLTGTKYGCGIAQCGACTVHIDGSPVRSCVLPVSAVAAGAKIVTIEGASADPVAAKLQKAWIANDVPQCGYCQAGQIVATVALLRERLPGLRDTLRPRRVVREVQLHRTKGPGERAQRLLDRRDRRRRQVGVAGRGGHISGNVYWLIVPTSLSPRPLTQSRTGSCSVQRPATFSIHATACAVSSAGMMPSRRLSSATPRSASSSVTDTYSARPLSCSQACSGPTPG